MSSPSQPVRQRVERRHLRLRIGVERARGDDVGRQHDRERERVLVPQLLGHLAADEDLVRAAAEVLQHAELVLDLGAAGDEQEGPLDLAEQPAEVLELGEQEQAGVGGQELRDADRRGVRAVRRAEGVVDEEVAALGELAGELGIVLRLAGMEARVLEHLDPLVRRGASAGARAPARSGRPGPRPSAGRGASRRGPASASRSSRSSSVGSAARMRVSSATWPSSSGTFRSRGRARTCRRRPRRGPSAAGSSIRAACPSGRRGGTNSPTRCRTSRTP